MSFSNEQFKIFEAIADASRNASVAEHMTERDVPLHELGRDSIMEMVRSGYITLTRPEGGEGEPTHYRPTQLGANTVGDLIGRKTIDYFPKN